LAQIASIEAKQARSVWEISLGNGSVADVKTGQTPVQILTGYHTQIATLRSQLK
jgi:hypothetical protein